MNVLKKVAKKVENSKIVKNPKFLVIGLIIIVVLITLIYFIFLKYSPIMNFKYEGYAISGKEITENLLSGDSSDNNANKNIELTKIEEQGTIFKKLNDYFVGSKEKTEINLNYPIYINGNSSLYNLSEGSTLISRDFEEVSGYPNLSISEGKIYDGSNLERADAKEYIFVKTTDNIYINLYEIKIKTTANEYTIPVNSIIAFTENSIRYYSVNNNVLVFNQINDIDNNSNVQMVENIYTYEELLTKLGILQEESNNTESSNSQENIIQENTANENNTNNDEKQNEETDEYTSADQNGYIKPEVTAENFTAEVYTAKSTLHIKDPSGRIVEAPTFEIYKDGKIYLRRAFSNSGEIQITGLIPETEYEVIGKYIYLNENNQKVENTFYEGTFTTKGYEELGSIEIQKENGEIFSNKIQLTKVKITSDLNAEVLKGINQVEIETGEIRTVLKNGQVNELLQGKEITIESSEGLKSDSKINYVIRFYDNNGVELKVNNNEGETRTSKEAPTVRVNIKEQDIVSVTLGLKLTNRDNVELENYKYVVTRPNGEIVQEKRLSENETELLLEDLDQNQYYKISIYADYDLNDNRGKQEQVEIGNLVFATQPISTLGSLELTVENKELTSTTSTISYKINEDRTDKRLIQILNELTIKIIEQPSNNEDKTNSNNNQGQKEGIVVYTDILSGEEIENLQQAGTKEIKYENLKSNTTYTIEITGNVQLGNTQETIPITYNYKEFITLKIPAKIEIRNQFVTGNLIDFDVRIEDINNAVLNNTVRMELRNSSNDLIDLQELKTNEDYIRKTYEKLEENQTYKLSFFADQYNEGSTDETYKVNYLIKEIEIITEPGISGSIGLAGLVKQSTGKNLVDPESAVNWQSDTFNTWGYYKKDYDKENDILSFSGKGQYSQTERHTYDLSKYKGETLTVSFEAKMSDTSNGFNAWVVNSEYGNKVYQIQNLSKDKWNTYTVTVKNNLDGYIGFQIAINDINYTDFDTLMVKNLQIELGDKKTSYEKFNYEMVGNFKVNLEDKRNEITSNKYYIKILENDNLLVNEENILNDEHNIVDLLKSYKFEEDSNYKIQLIVNINNREYVLDNYEFNTDNAKEIKGISSVEDYLKIQPNGEYIVLNNLELSGKDSEYRFGTSNFGFNGVIDFNGHTITVHTAKHNNAQALFYIIEEKGTIKNLVLDYYVDDFNNFNAINGVFSTNYGTIDNVQINLKECTDIERTNVKLFGGTNYGIINNFAINSEKSLIVSRGSSLGVGTNYGTMKNGYAYGENIKAIYGVSNQNRDVGVICISNLGTIKNIYSLVNVETAGTINSNNIANVISNNSQSGQARNIYSVGYGTKDEAINGPTIYNVANTQMIENIFYFTDIVFNNTNNQKSTLLALWDNNFQNSVLNSENSFNVDELISNGYYPQINMPSCMPVQPYIELPKVEDKDLPDILSSEVIENQNESAKVKIIVNNPSAETITNIKVKNINCTIERQEYKDGKTDVIVKLDNPILFISKYSVMQITTKGAYGSSYNRYFEDNERILNVDLYREINSIDDWKAISKSPTENYILMSDLDLKNESNSIIITTTLKGKINGNNHTIKNIILNSSYLIYEIAGELNNLNILNCEITSSGHTAPIYRVTGHINNCHIKNIKLNSTDTTTTTYQGGLIGSLSGVVDDCSISNVKITNNNSFLISIGGLVGYASEANISNCYVQNLEMKILNCINYDGIGGLVGRVNNNTKINNCYVTGIIDTDGNNIGGLVGKIVNNTNLNNSISKVNITGSPSIFGGIVGQIWNSGSTIKNNLFLGDLYTSRTNIEGARIVYTSLGTQENNYYYENQKINGLIKKQESKYALSLSELLNENTYINKIGLGDSYNYKKINCGVLPKLLYTDKEAELPNQEDIYIDENNDLEILAISTEKDTISSVIGQIELSNPKKFEITKIDINGMDITINSINTQGELTFINFKATPIKYYDSYKLEKVYYKNGKEEKVFDTEAKIEQQFFKEIYSFEDWQAIEVGEYQNYKIMNNLDFSNKTNIKTNLTIGRLEGPSDGTLRKIKNINIEFNSANNSLIKTIAYSMKNLKFENIEINSTAKNVNYNNLIKDNNGEIENVEFENITLNTSNVNYVGIIGNSSGYVNNIKMSNINITGQKYVSGLLCYSNSSNGIENIDAEKITIKANGDTVAGVVAYNRNNYINNIEIRESEIEGNNNVGGAIGDAIGKNDNDSIKNITAESINVKGENKVGGLIGISNNYGLRYSKIKSSTIVGNGNYLGGAIGYKNDWSTANNIVVEDCTIENNNVNSEGTGGITGYDSGNTTNYNYIKNSTINSVGKSVGGLFGIKLSNTGLAYSAGYNLNIIGDSNVGGLIGSGNAKMYGNYINAEVEAYADTAGGIVGNLKNENMTGSSNSSSLFQNYFVGTVTGKQNVGGQVGKIESDIYIGNNDIYFYYSNYVQADLHSNDNLTISLGIGNRPEQNKRLKDMYYYKFSTINEQNPNEQNEIFISKESYLVEEDLKKQSTYISKLKWNTSVWNYTKLEERKYPTIKYSNFKEEQEGIDLPIDSEHIIGDTESSQEIQGLENQEQLEQTFKYNNKTIETYSTYSVITAEDGSKATRNTKLYVKDNNLYAVPSILYSDLLDNLEVVPVSNNLIIDSYNGKEYETVLGSDYKLYDLKEPIEYPENFVNTDIESIGNNLNNDSHEVEVIYKNGDKIKFNYQTGEVISSSKENSEKIGVFDYLKEKISEIGNSNSEVSKEIKTKYEESKELQTKLEETSVEEAIEKQNIANEEQGTEGITGIENNVTNNSLTKNKYISVYDEKIDDYLIYNEEELLDTTKEEVVSENEKIKANNLNEYYESEGETKNTKLGIVWIVIIIIGVGITLFVLGKKIGIRGRC